MLKKGGRLDEALVLKLGVQMIERVRHIHSRGYIHRDLRPEHFLYGRDKRPDRLFISGLVHSRKYLRIDKKHVDYKDNKLSFTGTARYSSINSLLGI